MKHFFVLSLLLTLATGVFAQKKAEHRVVYYDNGQVKFEGTFVQNKPIGTLKRYYENGQLYIVQQFDEQGGSTVQVYSGMGTLQAEGAYVGSQRVGLWKYYTEQKKLFMVEHYIDGLREGECEVYNAEGQVIDKMSYHQDQLDGLRQRYFNNGQVQASAYYQQGVAQGPYASFYENGAPDERGSYTQGKKDGWWVSYDANGKPDSLYYTHGSCPEAEARLQADLEASEVNHHLPDPAEFRTQPDAYFQ